MKNVFVEQQNELENIDSKNWITKSNELIESTYKLSLQEQRILLILASKVQPSDETLKTYRFRARDFIEIIGNKKGTGFYSYLKETVNGLQKQVLTINKDGKQRNYNWVITSIYEDNEGYITLQFHPELKGFFLELKEKFTTYQLENVVRLNSVYSIRIYELLKQYEKLKKRYLTILELRHFLGIESTKYQQYGHLKSKVLLAAQNEINKKTDIQFTFNEFKTGRKITSIEFEISSKDKKEVKVIPDSKIGEEIKNQDSTQLSFLDEVTEENPLKIQLIKLGVSNDKIVWLLHEFAEDQIIRNIEYVHTRIDNGDIKHPGSYTVKAIQKDYGKVLESPTEKVEDAVDDPAGEAIRQFILENIPKQKITRLEPVPGWLYKEKAIELFAKYIPEEEAKILWENRKDEIVAEINERSKKMIIRR